MTLDTWVLVYRRRRRVDGPARAGPVGVSVLHPTRYGTYPYTTHGRVRKAAHLKLYAVQAQATSHDAKRVRFGHTGAQPMQLPSSFPGKVPGCTERDLAMAFDAKKEYTLAASRKPGSAM